MTAKEKEYRWVVRGQKRVFTKDWDEGDTFEEPPRKKGFCSSIMIQPDFQQGLSPIDGTPLTSRRQWRDHMRKHGVECTG